MIRFRLCSHLLIWSLLPLLLACATRKPALESVIPIVDRAPPDWLRQTPSDPIYYFGIGYTPQSADPAVDQRIALENAREALLENIKVSMRTASTDPKLTPELWDRVAWDGVAQDLLPVPAFDVYLDNHKRRAYAYVRLTRSGMLDILKRRREAQEPRVKRSMALAREALATGQPLAALREQLVALHRVAGPEGLLMPGEKADTLLRVEVEQELHQILSGIELRRISGPEQSRLADVDQHPLVVQCLSRSGATPIGRMPVSFRFAVGNGDITPTAVTGSDGMLSVRLLALDPRTSPIEIVATPDLQGLLSASKLPPLPDAAFASMELPQAHFTVSIQPPRLLLTYIERGGTGGTRGAVVAHELAEAFRAQGIVVQEASVDFLVSTEVFRSVEAGKDPGTVENADYVGVVAISLTRTRVQKSKYQDVLTGEGIAVFRLYDLSRRQFVFDLRVPQTINGFSQGDVERSFFLQAVDELRSKVVNELADHPFYSWSR